MEKIVAPIKLSRSLGVVDGAALIFSNVVGVGIFTTSGLILKSVPDTNSFLLIWLLGGTIALIGAFAYARLALLFPRSGGEYIYLSKVFGPLAGFLTGWTSFVAGFSGAIAASAVGFGAYLTSLFGGDENMQTVAAVLLIFVVSLFHVRGVKFGSRLNFWLCSLAIAAVAIMLGATFFYKGGYQPVVTNPEGNRTNMWLMALIPVMFTYSGWNAAAYVTEEIKDPHKNILRILTIGTLAVILLYLLLNFMYIKLIPWEEIIGTIQIGDLLANRLMGPSGAWIVTGIIIVALASSVSAMIMAGPRVYFAMARDKLLPEWINQLHPKYKTPYLSIILQSSWSIVLLLTGSFEQILIYTGFSIILFSTLAVIALLVVDYRRGKLMSYRNVPYAAFIVISTIIVFNAIGGQPVPSLVGLFIIGLGIPLYYFLKSKVL